jgi:hypothetical protein
MHPIQFDASDPGLLYLIQKNFPDVMHNALILIFHQLKIDTYLR